MGITRRRVGGLDVCVSAMRRAGGAFALGAFVLGAFALGAFVVHLLSETPKSMHFVVVLQGGAFVLITAWCERRDAVSLCTCGVFAVNA